MRCMVALIILLSSVSPVFSGDFSPLEPDATKAERRDFYLTWLSQNSRAAFQKTRREVLDITLVIDPSRSRMYKVDGNDQFVGSVPLPEHPHWKAFHITPNGIAELKFPVRLRWVHSNQALRETIFIQSLDVVKLDSGEVRRFAMSFSPGGFARPGGYGTVPATMSYPLPENSPASEDNAGRKTMLLGVGQSSLKYERSMTVGTTTISVDSTQ